MDADVAGLKELYTKKDEIRRKELTEAIGSRAGTYGEVLTECMKT